MVVKLDDEIGVSRVDVAATRAANVQQQPAQSQTTAPATSQGTIIAVIPGEQGRPDAVVYPVTNPRPDAPNTTIFVPDPAGHLDAYGNPVPGSKSAAPTSAEQKIITGYVQNQGGVPANIDKDELTNQLPAPAFKPTGQKVRIDDLSQGGDFAATRQRLLSIPDGTQVQINDSSNDDVYAWQGGLVNRKGEYYTGYGGVTAGMAADYRAREQEVAKEIEKNDSSVSQSQTYRKATMDLIKSGGKSSDIPDPAVKMVLGGREYADPLNAMYWYGLGGKINEAYDKFAADVLNKSDKLNKMGLGVPRPVTEFAVGFDRSIVGAVAGVSTAAGAIIGLGEAGAQDAFAGRVGKLGTMYAGVPDVWTKGFEGSVTSVPGMLVTGAAPSLFKESPNYLQGAGEAAGFFSVLALGSAAGMKGAGVKTPSVKSSIGDVGAGVSKSFNKNVGASGKGTPFRTVDYAPGGSLGPKIENTNVKVSGRLAPTYDESIPGVTRSFIDNDNVYHIIDRVSDDPIALSNEDLNLIINDKSITKTTTETKKIKYDIPKDEAKRLLRDTTQESTTITTKKHVIDLTKYSDKDELMSFVMERQEIPKAPISMKGVTSDPKLKNLFDSLMMNDKGSAVIGLMEKPRVKTRAKSKASTVEKMTYNPVSRMRVKSLSINKNLAIGAGMFSASFAGALGQSARAKQPNKIINPGPLQKVPIPAISINDLIVGPGQWQPPKTRQYSGTPDQQRSRGSSDIMALSLGAGILGGMAASRMLSPGRLKGLGSDMGGFKMPRGIGMKKDKYLTGDVTGLIFGKKKKKSKRR